MNINSVQSLITHEKWIHELQITGVVVPAPAPAPPPNLIGVV
jgi:hypothetical protein